MCFANLCPLTKVFSGMSAENERLLDNTGWRILEELQGNARLTHKELDRRVNLSAPAAAERIGGWKRLGSSPATAPR